MGVFLSKIYDFTYYTFKIHLHFQKDFVTVFFFRA